jgi:hypothetical protein
VIPLNSTRLTVKTEDHPNKYVREEITIAAIKILTIRGIGKVVSYSRNV